MNSRSLSLAHKFALNHNESLTQCRDGFNTSKDVDCPLITWGVVHRLRLLLVVALMTFSGLCTFWHPVREIG